MKFYKMCIVAVIWGVMTFVADKTVMAQSNRFLVTKDFSATYNYKCGYNGDCDLFTEGTIRVSFYMKNVSDGGISVLISSMQGDNFTINHMLSNSCYKKHFSGIPSLNRSIGLDEARRIAVYIPKEEGLYVTVTIGGCKSVGESSFYNGSIKGGVVSGNVTVIKGRRILTRPISGRF